MDWFDPVAGWLLLGGAGGGALNAFSSGARRLLPTRVSQAGGPQIADIGVLCNLAIGAAVGLAALGFWKVGGVAAGSSFFETVRLVSWGFLLSFLLCRWATTEIEKRLLHAAACKASTAPAAHPDTVRALERARPAELYALCDGLVVRPAPWPTQRWQQRTEVVHR